MNIKWVGANTNNFGQGRAGKTINKIVMHWIVGTLESADATFANPDRRATAHYGIGDDEIHQYVADENTAWHASNLAVNRESIGIEHEGGWLLPDRVNRFKPTDKTHETSAKLVADICQRYNIPIDREHIRLHKEYRNTQCPGSLDVDRIIEMARNYSVPPPPPSAPSPLEITDQTKIPQILDEQGSPMEVQAIRSSLNDMRRDLASAGDVCVRKIKEAVELVSAEERTSCKEQIKDTKKDYGDKLLKANLKYEKLLLQQIKNYSPFALFRLGLKKLFGRSGK